MKSKKLLLIVILTFVSFLTLIGQAGAQSAQDMIAVPNGNIGNFFVSLLAGVILALGFQMLLSILGNVEQKFSQGFNRAPSTEAASPLLQITTGMGIWILATTSLSLFLAS